MTAFQVVILVAVFIAGFIAGYSFRGRSLSGQEVGAGASGGSRDNTGTRRHK